MIRVSTKKVIASHNSPKPPGRPSTRDWDYLYGEWVRSGLGIKAFLSSRKIRWNSTSQRTTHGWEARAGVASAHLDAELDQPPAPTPEDDQAKIDQLWRQVSTWRLGQGEVDYKTADRIRLHASLILKDGLLVEQLPDGKQQFKTKLGSEQLRRLAATMKDVQHIQRLALGLSTENVGLEAQVKVPGAIGIDGRVPGEEEDAMQQAASLPPQIVIYIPSNGKMAEEQEG